MGSELEYNNVTQGLITAVTVTQVTREENQMLVNTNTEKGIILYLSTTASIYCPSIALAEAILHTWDQTADGLVFIQSFNFFKLKIVTGPWRPYRTFVLEYGVLHAPVTFLIV